MKDFYPSPTQFSKLHKPAAKPMTRLANDMTIRRPGIVRPGTLTGKDEASAKKRYLDAAVLKRNAEPVVFNPQVSRPLRGWERTADKKSAEPSASKPETFGGIKSIAAALRSGNWRAFVSSKHKKYTADRGVKVQPATFRLQSGIIVVLALVALATAKTSAPSGIRQPVATPAGSSQSAPMTPASSLQGGADQTSAMTSIAGTAPTAFVAPSSSRSSSVTTGNGTGASQPKASSNGTTVTIPTAPTTGSVVTPAPTTTTPDPVVTDPNIPVVVPDPDPVPTPDPTPTDPVGGILDGVGGTLQSTTNGLNSIL